MMKWAGRITVTLPACALYSSAHAGVSELTFFADWQATVRDYTTVDFTGFPSITIITDQYADLGVLFTDGTDYIANSGSYPNDGSGLAGNPDIHLEFAQPMYAIGLHFPGAVQFFLYSQDTLIYTSSVFQDFPPQGEFAGLVSDTPFDSVIIVDPVLPGVFIDDLHFGPPIPAPSAIVMLAAVPWMPNRRRRLN